MPVRIELTARYTRVVLEGRVVTQDFVRAADEVVLGPSYDPKANILLDRKVLADMAVHDPQGFQELAGVAKSASSTS